jgi:hypothetical protein
MTHKRVRLLAALTITVIAALCLAACGSSSSSSSSSSSAAGAIGGAGGAGAGAAGGTANRAKLTACLKQHGVTLPPRPAGGGGGYGPPPGAGNGGGGGGSGGFGGGQGPAGNPKFRAAFQACGGGAGFRGRQGNFRPSSATITKFADCVKQHGYTLPKANLSGKGPVYPVNIERNAKFQSASRACQSVLRPTGAGGAPPGA